ncbi:MAG: hypothetical protein DRJ67_11390 [Thermoprotei archaeon]|nr:MAG: hypothetical protein DRJ67_11390 [Thermoprotei archaeon]
MNSPFCLKIEAVYGAGRGVALKLKLGRVWGRIRIVQGHILILGRSGSGKSNTARVIAQEASRRVPVLLLDWSGEHAVLSGFRRLAPGDGFSLNIFERAGMEDSDHVDVLVDLFDATFHLTPPQLYMLRTAVKNALARGARGVGDLLEAVEELPVRSYYDHETKMALVRRLTPLAEGRAGRALKGGGWDPAELFRGNFVVDLSVFRSIYAKRLYTLLVLKLLYDHALLRGMRDQIAHMTLVEEAWNVVPYRRLHDEPSIGERLFAELRKYGECLVAIAQNPSEIAWSLSNNAEILIIHSMLAREVEVLGLTELREVISRLKRGEAVVVERGRIRRIRVRRYVPHPAHA